MIIPHITPRYGRNEMRAIQKYLRSGGFLTEYKYTEKFEQKLAHFLKVPYVSLVPNGTLALILALACLPKKSKVAVPNLTMIATYNAVVSTGNIPVLVDVDIYGCLDLEKIKESVDAIIYVSLNGRSADMEMVQEYCKDRNIVLIEDACQALGSKSNDQYLGTFGRFGCFSLGFHKIITTGQGGFIVSHTKKDYEAIERLKDFGRLKGGNDVHDYFGLNFKFTDLQAVFGLEQLKTIEWRIQKKRQLYKWYHDFSVAPGYTPWFIEYLGDAKKTKIKLAKLGIESRQMYPPLNTQKSINIKGDFPYSHTISKQVLWLPSSLDLTRWEVNRINANL